MNLGSSAKSKLCAIYLENISSRSFLAFTLAEVLIVMGVLGVILQITIPTLVNKINSEKTAATLQHSFSVLSSAYISAVQENGTPDNWELSTENVDVGGVNLKNQLKPYLKVLKDCGTQPGCFPNVNYLTLNRQPFPVNFDQNTAYAKIRLQDGTSLLFYPESTNCTKKRGENLALSSICALIYVDINGDANPNRIGFDMFLFRVTKYDINPAGTALETIGTSTFDLDCKDVSTGWGQGCTAWVLYKNNMDYLKCSDLDWITKSTCD